MWKNHAMKAAMTKKALSERPCVAASVTSPSAPKAQRRSVGRGSPAVLRLNDQTSAISIPAETTSAKVWLVGHQALEAVAGFGALGPGRHDGTAGEADQHDDRHQAEEEKGGLVRPLVGEREGGEEGDPQDQDVTLALGGAERPELGDAEPEQVGNGSTRRPGSRRPASCPAARAARGPT